MANKKIYPALLLAVMSVGAYAQSDLSKEVTVTRPYEPSVSESFKMGLTPEMSDTTKLRPDFNYEITPQPLRSGFDVSPIRPVSLNTVDNTVLLPFYLKVAGGFPLQSALDFSFSKQLDMRTKVGVLVSHYGTYSDIENDMNVDAPAFAAFNNLSAFGQRMINHDLALEGRVGYAFNKVTRYGYFNSTALPSGFETTSSALAQFFHNVNAGVTFGNSFSDMSKFNFSVSADIFYDADKYKFDQFGWIAAAEAGIGVGYSGDVRLNLSYDATDGQQKFSGYSNNIFTGGLAYNFDNGGLRFLLGADYASYKQKGDADVSEGRFLPQFKLEYDVTEGLTPYVVLNSQVVKNSYHDLARINPYVYSGLSIPNTTEYEGRAGIKGTLFGMVKYNLFGGYGMIEDYYEFANMYDTQSQGNLFAAITDKAKYWTAGASVEANLWNSFKISAAADYYHYHMDVYEDAEGPDIVLNIKAEYNHRNKLFIDAGFTMWGERTFHEMSSMTLSSLDRDPVFNLNAGVNYFFSKQLGVFVKADNILNEKMYIFNRYPGLGINAMAGVKLTF